MCVLTSSVCEIGNFKTNTSDNKNESCRRIVSKESVHQTLMKKIDVYIVFLNLRCFRISHNSYLLCRVTSLKSSQCTQKNRICRYLDNLFKLHKIIKHFVRNSSKDKILITCTKLEFGCKRGTSSRTQNKYAGVFLET